ncbi:MAG: SUMF1/EgtB/PvdO family nonheme iron enzyme [Bryobacteraceae bacterium]
MLRGGSWNNNQENARAGNRNNNHPDNRNNNIGFRVVCSSHIHLHLSRCRQVPLAKAGGMRRKGVGWRGKVQSARLVIDELAQNGLGRSRGWARVRNGRGAATGLCAPTAPGAYKREAPPG